MLYLRNNPGSPGPSLGANINPNTSIGPTVGLSPIASEPMRRPSDCFNDGAESSTSSTSDLDVYNADALVGGFTNSMHVSHASAPAPPDSTCSTNALVLGAADATVTDSIAASKGVKRGQSRESGCQCDHALDNALLESKDHASIEVKGGYDNALMDSKAGVEAVDAAAHDVTSNTFRSTMDRGYFGDIETF